MSSGQVAIAFIILRQVCFLSYLWRQLGHRVFELVSLPVQHGFVQHTDSFLLLDIKCYREWDLGQSRRLWEFRRSRYGSNTTKVRVYHLLHISCEFYHQDWLPHVAVADELLLAQLKQRGQNIDFIAGNVYYDASNFLFHALPMQLPIFTALVIFYDASVARHT